MKLSLLCAVGLVLASAVAADDRFIPVGELASPSGKGRLSTRVIEDGKLLFLEGDGSTGPSLIEIGWIPVKPGTTYRVSYWVREGEQPLSGPAVVDLMIRQHPRRGARPVGSHQRVSSRTRSLAPENAQQWTRRQVEFQTGPETNWLSGAILVDGLNGSLKITGVEIEETKGKAVSATATSEEAFEKRMEELRRKAAERQPLVPRTLVFSRSQMKYGLERNYYHTWPDRPLYASREFRVPGYKLTPLGSYRRILQEVVKYDIDGLAFFPETTGRMEMFDMTMQAGVEGVQLLPEFIPTPYSEESVKAKAEVVRKALATPACPRINGKLLITSYNAGQLPPEEWARILAAVREQVGDTFLFLPALTNGASLKPFGRGKVRTPEMVEKEQEVLRSYLAVCDGIYFHYPPALRNLDRTFDAEFYRDVFIPIFKSVLAEPPFRNKYLGLSAYRGHLNPDRGNGFLEDYTRTMRASFEVAMDAKPDVIILPEWDEVNENTGWRPMVNGAHASQRILRYFMSRIKGKAPTPRPGDDTSVPNLILTTRKVLTLGEEVVVELVNVPDSEESHTYTAEVALVDDAGKVVHTFEPVTLESGKLTEHRLTLPSERFPHTLTLTPTLKVRKYKGRDFDYSRGFHPIHVRATWNWDDLAVRQPLRDLLRPEVAELKWGEKNADGSLVLTGTVSAPEDLLFVEVLGENDEVYVHDPGDEFLRADPDTEAVVISFRSINDQPLSGQIEVNHGTPRWVTKGVTLLTKPMEVTVEKSRIRLKSLSSQHERCVLVTLPKTQIAEAELVVNTDRAQFAIPVREIFEKQMVAKEFGNGLQFTMTPYRKQFDMPLPLNGKSAGFSVRVWPETPNDVYHLRLISRNGRVYRSAPLIPPGAKEGETTRLRIYSDTEQRGVNVPVAASRIPRVEYEFRPERGAVLLSPAGRPFWATLGGFVDTTTGVGNGYPLFANYPNPVRHASPEWVDGLLRFRGEGSYLILPRETLPRRGAFTLELEVRPETAGDQPILISGIRDRAHGLALRIVNGCLEASFMDRDFQGHRFTTSLAIPAGEWSTVKVRYDFENLILSVNGKEEAFPLSLPANNIGYGIMGGWNEKWFQGDLRKLRIVHHAE